MTEQLLTLREENRAQQTQAREQASHFEAQKSQLKAQIKQLELQAQLLEDRDSNREREMIDLRNKLHSEESAWREEEQALQD